MLYQVAAHIWFSLVGYRAQYVCAQKIMGAWSITKTGTTVRKWWLWYKLTPDTARVLLKSGFTHTWVSGHPASNTFVPQLSHDRFDNCWDSHCIQARGETPSYPQTCTCQHRFLYMRPIGILVWHTIIFSMGDKTLFIRTLSIWILSGLYASLIDPPLPGQIENRRWSAL